MAGILPSNGVAPDGTQNGLSGALLAAGCPNLYYGPRCNPRMDPFAMNAMISEIINAVNAAGLAYDCNSLDNLASAIALMAPPPALVNSMPDAVLQDSKPAGTAGGALGTAWQTHALTVETYDPANLITLAGNAFTPLINGYVRWNTLAKDCGLVKTRLYNVTDAVSAGAGQNGICALASEPGGASAITLPGVAFVSAGKQYRLEIRAQTTQGNLGDATNMGEPEIYATVEFYKAS